MCDFPCCCICPKDGSIVVNRLPWYSPHDMDAELKAHLVYLVRNGAKSFASLADGNLFTAGISLEYSSISNGANLWYSWEEAVGSYHWMSHTTYSQPKALRCFAIYFCISEKLLLIDSRTVTVPAVPAHGRFSLPKLVSLP